MAKKIAIVGAGPAGLVTAKYALELGFEVKVLEAEDELGGTFRWRAYEGSELVSSRQLTAFSDLRLTDEYYSPACSSRDHVMLEDYVRYLKDYAQHFGVLPHISFNSRVVSVVRTLEKPARYTVTWTHTAPGTAGEGFKAIGGTEAPGTGTESLECDFVAVCSGLHVIPNFPDIAGFENFAANGIEVLHSSAYKSKAVLAGKNVLICGLGETSSDVGHDAVHAPAKEVVVCHRNGFLSFPKRFNDFEVFGHRFDAELPIDTLISNLHESAYVHQFLKDRRFRWHFSDVFVRGLLTVLTGTGVGANQWFAPAKRIGRAYNFLNKSTKSLPYINTGFKKHYWWERFARVIEPDTGGKVIHLRPWISRVDADGAVHFIDNGTPEAEMAREAGPFRPDIVVLATGYRQEYGFLAPDLPRPAEADLKDIVKEGHESIGFIGFVRPNVGAIPPLAEMQAQWWLQLILGNLNTGDVREEHPHWHLLGREEKRIKYGVDHSSYAYALAKDVGGAPSVYPPAKVFRDDPDLLKIYAFAASFNTCFRLQGPYAYGGAAEVMRGEIWETVTRRGVIGNVVMGFVPMVFYGTVNLAVWTVDSLLRVVGFHL
ncbi:FAD/NAD(P)-binding domain-containing protein [Hyaloraphidium curvatum]|nr:FAD/NAD(P)-binding domain-containing protein [Hyaloraphidium curvatum]